MCAADCHPAAGYGQGQAAVAEQERSPQVQVRLAGLWVLALLPLCSCAHIRAQLPRIVQGPAGDYCNRGQGGGCFSIVEGHGARCAALRQRGRPVVGQQFFQSQGGLAVPLCNCTWRLVSAGLHRQVIYGGLRIGLYDPVKSLFVGKDHQVLDSSCFSL